MKHNLRLPQQNFLFPAFRWMTSGIAVLVLAAVIGGIWLKPYSSIFFTIASASAAAWIIYLVLEKQRTLQIEVERLQDLVAEFDRVASSANQVLQLTRKFLEANEEDEVIEQLLKTVVQISGARSASVVPLDELGQPLSLFRHGNFPKSVTDSWLEYLASPAVRSKCESCQNSLRQVKSCSLLEQSVRMADEDASKGSIYCLPIRRGEAEFGVLNLYLPEGLVIDLNTQELLQGILAETTLVLDSLRLRRNLQSTESKLQSLRQKDDLASFLRNILENLYEAIRSDYAVLYLEKSGLWGEPVRFQVGQFERLEASPFENLILDVLKTRQSILIGDMGDADASPVRVRSVVAVPIINGEFTPVGVLIAGNRRAQGFNPQHLGLVSSFSNQIGLAIRHIELMSELEYKTVIAERTRLAREIHDGLAQTLGFLKLQTAQMLNLLSRKEVDRLSESLNAAYRILSEAYLDTRQAIDDLRASPGETGFAEWLKQTASEFESTNGIPVSLVMGWSRIELKPEIQAQVVRIIQEILSNVRKHASAGHVRIECRLEGSKSVIEIEDDGRGFIPEDVPDSARYGLRGIRERAELIGAGLQITSQPEGGTLARITLDEQHQNLQVI